MKITKTELKQIIKEEYANVKTEVAGVGLSDKSADPDFENSPEQLKKEVHRLKTHLDYCEMYADTLRKDLGSIVEKYGDHPVARDITDALNRE